MGIFVCMSESLCHTPETKTVKLKTPRGFCFLGHWVIRGCKRQKGRYRPRKGKSCQIAFRCNPHGQINSNKNYAISFWALALSCEAKATLSFRAIQLSTYITRNRHVRGKQRLHWHFQWALPFSSRGNRTSHYTCPRNPGPFSHPPPLGAPVHTVFLCKYFFSKVYFSERINTHSHPERLRLPFSISLAAPLRIASPLWSIAETCPLRSAEKDFHATEWKTFTYKSDLKMAQSTY